MLDSLRAHHPGLPRPAAADRRTLGGLPCRGGRRARPRCAGADLSRVDAVRPGAAPGRGPPRLGGHHRRRARRHGQGRAGPGLLGVVGQDAVAGDLRRRRPAPAPRGRGAHLRRPGHRGRAAAAAGRGGPRRRRGVPVHLQHHDGRLAARARGHRLPRRRGPVLAPPARRRRGTDRAPADTHHRRRSGREPTSNRRPQPTGRPPAGNRRPQADRLPTPPPTAHRPDRQRATAAHSPQADRLSAPAAGDVPDATARGTAHDLVLAFYGRIPLDSLTLDGDRRLFDQLVDWDPER